MMQEPTDEQILEIFEPVMFEIDGGYALAYAGREKICDAIRLLIRKYGTTQDKEKS